MGARHPVGEIWDARTRAWVEGEVGAQVVGGDRLAGGITSTMLTLSLEDGRTCVLRLMTVEPWRRHAAALLARESRVQRMLAIEAVPAPTSLATDLEGVAASAPAHLMSHLPGRLELDRWDPDVCARLAGLLATVHAVAPAPDARPRPYQSWAGPEKRVVPAWTERPALWRRAFAVLDGTPPSFDGTFLHRDFHLGNVLWRSGEVSGLVDWVETSWGPAGLDVAHCGSCLAMLHGPDAATAFAERYVSLTGRTLEPAYWAAMDAVGFLPDPLKVVRPWRELGVDLADEEARDRLERHLDAVLEPAAG